MVRPTRTATEIKNEIVLCVAAYTVARTDWENGRRADAKKIALRKAARLARQLCERSGHQIGMDVAFGVGKRPPGEPGEVDAAFKCLVCDTSGDVKREAATGETPEEKRRERTARAYHRDPAPKPSVGECVKCGSIGDPRYLENGVCDICRKTPACSKDGGY